MPLSPTEKKKIRTNMSNFCINAEANEIHWHYTWARRFYYTDNPNTHWTTKDCSGYVGNVYWNAMHDTNIYIADPLGYRYEGIGNTATAEAWLRKHGKAITEASGWLVGDIARWGTGRRSHMAVCRNAGTWTTSVWSSFGEESGPEPTTLGYRTDYIGSWRHPALL